jgi:hypothetical protein
VYGRDPPSIKFNESAKVDTVEHTLLDMDFYRRLRRG